MQPVDSFDLSVIFVPAANGGVDVFVSADTAEDGPQYERRGQAACFDTAEKLIWPD
jgi:hypothetical protein